MKHTLLTGSWHADAKLLIVSIMSKAVYQNNVLGKCNNKNYLLFIIFVRFNLQKNCKITMLIIGCLNLCAYILNGLTFVGFKTKRRP